VIGDYRECGVTGDKISPSRVVGKSSELSTVKSGALSLARPVGPLHILCRRGGSSLQAREL
jgi:hypothetical protein